MKNFGHPLLSLGAPFLILLSSIGLIHRQGSDQLTSVPALVVGSGLILSGMFARRYRRNKLLLALRRNEFEDS